MGNVAQMNSSESYGATISSHGAITMRVWLIMLLALFVLPAASEALAADFHVTFGIIEGRGPAPAFAKETTTIPLRDRKTGLIWGFRVTSVPPGDFEGHYVMKLPGNPRVVGSSLRKQSHVENSGQLITAKFRISNGVYWRSMVFDEGDPPGQWEISVFVNQKLVQTTRIEVHPESSPLSR